LGYETTKDQQGNVSLQRDNITFSVIKKNMDDFTQSKIQLNDLLPFYELCSEANQSIMSNFKPK
jgi:hypothetical protein